MPRKWPHPTLLLPAAFFVVQALPVTEARAAQDYPNRNITLVAPFPAGGGTDLFARTIAQQLTARFGKQVIIENRTGASGNIGAESVVRAVPDGHTLLYTASTIALSQAVYSKLTFSPARDLQAITMTASIPQVLVVHPSLPVKSVHQLIKLAQKQGDDLSYSSGGPGSAGNFAMEFYKLRTQSRMTHIPYRGAAPALTALFSGEVQLAFLVPTLVKSHAQNGKLRAIGVAARKRSATLPEVPTLQEQGVSDFEVLQWHGMFAPAKTPQNIVTELYQAVSAALNSAEVKKRYAAEGAEIGGTTPAEFTQFVNSELTRWSDVAKRARMRVN